MKLFTIGCSFTEGTGLKRQSFESYSHKLGTKLKLEYYNFGAAGASNDYIFRKIFELINSNTITKEDIIVIQWTHFLRKELPIKYKKYNFFHYVPNSFHAYDDKKIMEMSGFDTSAQNANRDIEGIDDMHLQAEKANKEILEKYIVNFIQEEYQLNTTKNYINSLYTYLEYWGYKHIHFFGWNDCIIDSIFDKKPNFIKESFGGYTSTIRNEHPNRKGHEMWADFLYKKLLESNYVNQLQYQIDNYRKELYRLYAEIEVDIENTNKKIKEEQQIHLENEMEKIKNIRMSELEKEIKEETMRLNQIKDEIKNQIESEKQKLNTFFKPKTLI